MSGLNLTLTYDDLGVRRAAEGLSALGAGLRDALFGPIGQTLKSSTIDRFETGVDPDGEAWVPSLRARLASGKTLDDQGDLKRSIDYFEEDDAVEIGTADIRAGVHQFGATITGRGGGPLTFRLADGSFRSVASVTIPARPFVGLSAEDGEEVVLLAERALARAFYASVG